MCEDCEVFMAVLGVCLCETFCFCCAEDLDAGIRRRQNQRQRKTRSGNNYTAAPTSKTAIVTQPKPVNGKQSEPEEQPMVELKKTEAEKTNVTNSDVPAAPPTYLDAVTKQPLKLTL